MAATTTGLGPYPSLPLRRSPWLRLHQNHRLHLRLRPHNPVTVRAFRRRGDFDGFARRVASGEALKDAWRHANDGLARFLYDAQKTAERLDRRYSFSRRLDSFARSAASRVRDLDRDLGLQLKWRSFSLDFRRNWPRVCQSPSSPFTLIFPS